MKRLKMWALLLSLPVALTACRHKASLENPYESDRYSALVLKNAEGKIKCEIVVPKEAGPVASFAGKELKKFMSLSLGGNIPLIEAPTGNALSIILGNNALALGEGVNVEKLPRDGFVIESHNGRIFIAGKDDLKKNPEKILPRGYWGQLYERGTLFGVYEFLERYLGVRFYFPGEIGTVIPKLNRLGLPDLKVRVAPDYTVRKFSFYAGETPSGLKGPAAYTFKNLNFYRSRSETKYIPNCHGLGRLGYIRRFGKSNPEYFALMSNGKRHNSFALPHSGQLCYNSGVREEIYKDAKAFLTGKSAASRGLKTKYGAVWDPSGFQKGYFNIMPQDSFYPCHCDKCAPIFAKGKQAVSNFVWDFVCDTAERLKKEGVPGYVTMMAYSPYRLVPDRKIPDNVLVMLAERGPWTMKRPATYAKDEKEIKAWVNKLGHKIWLWTYANKHGKLEMPGIPDITPNVIGEYYKAQKPYIIGAYMESETDKFIYHYLNYYVFSKVLWDNDLDVEALLSEHYVKMFGSAAPVMEKIYGTFTGKWFQIIGKPIDTPLGPSCVPVSEYELWESVYPAKETDSIKAMFADAETRVAADPDALKRVRFMRTHLMDPLIKQRKLYSANKKEIEDLTFLVNPLPKTAKIAVDGKIDEKAWNTSSKIFLHPFKHKNNNGKKEVVRTIIRSMRDKENIYFAIECEEPAMKTVNAADRKLDDHDIWRDSSVELFLNPSGDKKHYYQLMINERGSLSDLAGLKIGANQQHNWKWNSDAKIAIGRTAKSWTAEIAIPIKKLPGFNENGFPANFNRNRILERVDKNYATLYTWSPFIKHGFHDLENFGSLIFKKRADENIVKNSDFSGKKRGRFWDGWFAPKANAMKNGQECVLVNDTFIKGGVALKLASPKGNRVALTQYLPKLKPNTKYLVSFYIKTKDVAPSGRGGAAGACVNIWGEKNRWFPKNYYTGTMPWSKQGFVLTTGKETNKKHKSYIRLYLIGAVGTVWFDDVRIREFKNNP